jgi:hypothetical protein
LRPKPIRNTPASFQPARDGGVGAQALGQNMRQRHHDQAARQVSAAIVAAIRQGQQALVARGSAEQAEEGHVNTMALGFEQGDGGGLPKVLARPDVQHRRRAGLGRQHAKPSQAVGRAQPLHRMNPARPPAAAATPATASHISTWSPAITPSVATGAAAHAALPVEVIRVAEWPGTDSGGRRNAMPNIIFLFTC